MNNDDLLVEIILPYVQPLPLTNDSMRPTSDRQI